MTRVWVLHESPGWYAPLDAALDRQGVPHDEIFLDRDVVDLAGSSPPGVYFNRLSGTAHTRGHGLAVDHCRALLRWLERDGRRIVNGRQALELALYAVPLIAGLVLLLLALRSWRELAAPAAAPA